MIQRIFYRAGSRLGRNYRTVSPGTGVGGLSGSCTATVIYVENGVVSITASPGRWAVIVVEATRKATEAGASPGISSPASESIRSPPGVPTIPGIPAIETGIRIGPAVPGAVAIPAVPAIPTVPSSEVIPAVSAVKIIIDQNRHAGWADKRIVISHVYVYGVKVIESVVRAVKTTDTRSIVIIVCIVIVVTVRFVFIIIIIRRVLVIVVCRIAGISVRIVVQVIVLSLCHTHRC